MLNSLYALILTDSLHLPTIIGYFNTRPAACQAGNAGCPRPSPAQTHCRFPH